jgi:uncharacterized damage-inducible protein DinB
MNADAIRHFFNYHFSENRTIWEYVSQLSDEQFTQDVSYSHGSVRNQIVHLMNVDDAWFSGLRGVEIQDELDPAVVYPRTTSSTRTTTPSANQRAELFRKTDRPQQP